ncbi:amidase [Dinoroseobacter shibae DFL 12 = DSM 16493]|jgi:Asp-tRNA(Asn)/Glu-tRNA(Gln) amidotransferase A subunit family amidase|uniref:Amidase n=1 Tax=Dinoroseobacter shibae (strain DSM 16493 / NCIMB 14021 / DFL 12) TaxID=398580 RepID=A8LP87_DINSH|nr:MULTISPECIES: amidase [Dinoroseobacter]ABV95152.1 amidase [Dinoroseobacter shibae DFL 12 = DSM 16493]MDD9718129.1 amidase [Dinoroseobacter sp. PD6]URF46565.1 amidase [Dinoroseobacter shibae]URF50871.1 amidase [Dinoroseobacter shibae]
MSDRSDLPDLSLQQMSAALRTGEVTALALLDAHLDRIAARDPSVKAWAWLDPDQARAQAIALDAAQAEGKALGPLHGIPVGLKDVIDTADMPTENGTPPDAGRQPDQDAWITARLRAVGAVIVGKTTTTELAFLNPTETLNPHNPNHTPGGSSAGSAASVAAGMVPLAVGTQTGGSVIRPAAFCGVVGVKPTFGAIPRQGVTMQSHTLDTLGVFTRDAEDAAFALTCMMDTEDSDPATLPPQDAHPAIAGATRPPVFGFVRPPEWDRASAETKAALEKLAQALGAIPLSLPESFEQVADLRARINFAEMAWHYSRYRTAGWDALSAATRDAMEAGAACAAVDYLAALMQREPLYASLDPLFSQVDCLLCPSALGAAPEGLSSTGDAIFNGLWTFMGTPCVTLPLPETEKGLPIGVQLVGRRGEDRALLSKAIWLQGHMGKN